MKIELTYMVSLEETGVVLAGFNSAAETWSFCRRYYVTGPQCRVSVVDSKGTVHKTKVPGEGVNTSTDLYFWAYKRLHGVTD